MDQLKSTIPITRSDDYLECCRETAKHARDRHDLALRGRDEKEIGDDLVGNGCGCGTLLRMVERAGARSAVGWLATDEQAAVLRPSGPDAKQGLTDQLPLPKTCAP